VGRLGRIVVAKKAKENLEPMDIDDDDDYSGPIPPSQLGDWKMVLPKEVHDAVDVYVELMREHGELRVKKNAARDACIEAMHNHEIERVPIDDGGKELICESVMKLKTQRAKTKDEGGGE
jgi:hypothetical protein